MRINRREVLVGILLALVLLIVLWAFAGQATAPVAPSPVATSTPSEAGAEAPAPPSALVRDDSETVALTKVTAQSTATFVVDGVRYGLTAAEGATLKEAMDRLDAETEFTYAYRNYAGLGAFVTSINNRASTGDLVWILYVNGEKSAAGISSTRIRSGDIIEWKLEESY